MEEVSIIVPMYNVEKYVEKCLNSLIKQTYKKIKIYAISDGSPDDSFKIAKEIAKKDNRIICISKENGGYGSVLKYAINMIDSNYFLICDPDDWLVDNAVEILINSALKEDLDLIVGDKYTVLVDDEKPKLVKSNSNYPFIKIIENQVESKNVEKYSFLYVSPHAKLYKTSIAKNIDFPEKVSYTDFLLYMISLSRAKKVKYIDIPLAYYLLDRPGNSNTDRTMRSVNNHIIVWKSIYDQLSLDNCDHPYLYNRLFYEFKMFLKSYSKYANDSYDDDIFNELNDIHIKLKNKKRIIKKVNNKSLKRKINYYLLLNNNISLKKYIKINKLFNRW